MCAVSLTVENKVDNKRKGLTTSKEYFISVKETPIEHNAETEQYLEQWVSLSELVL